MSSANQVLIGALRFAADTASNQTWVMKSSGIKAPHIGPVIRRLRKAKGLTLEDVALQVKGPDNNSDDKPVYDPSNLSKFERGRQGIDENYLYQICSLLGVTRAAVYEEADAQQGNRTEQLVIACRSLQPEYTDLAYAMVSALASHGLANMGREALNMPVNREAVNSRRPKKQQGSTSF